MYSQLVSISGGVSCIRKLRTCHAVVTETHMSRTASCNIIYMKFMLYNTSAVLYIIIDDGWQG